MALLRFAVPKEEKAGNGLLSNTLSCAAAFCRNPESPLRGTSWSTGPCETSYEALKPSNSETSTPKEKANLISQTGLY